jgi:hypothetical protein
LSLRLRCASGTRLSAIAGNHPPRKTLHVPRAPDLAAQGADTGYFHLYGRDDVEHIRLLGSEVVSRF